MTRDEARVFLQSLTDEYEVIHAEFLESQRRMSGMREVKSGLLRMYPDLEDEIIKGGGTADVEDRPKGAEAVAAVLRDTPGKWFSIPMIVRDMEARGWLPPGSENPTNAVRAAADRLVKADETNFLKDVGEKTQRSVYAYKPTPGRRPTEDDAPG